MTPTLPLEGVSVLDFTQIMAGPFCTMLLADMGADVVKVEKPSGGDDTRRMGPPFVNGESAAFLGINRNKRSVVLNIRHPDGLAAARRLAERADVLVQNFRPGTLERLGLGYEDALRLNPGLVYCNISGFGGTGPYSRRGGFDLVAQGMSGLMSITGAPGSDPVKVGVPITDLNAGMYSAYGILSAYISRLRTGRGQLVDTSLLEAGLAYTFWESAIYFATGETPSPLGSAHRMSAPYQAFRTSDGHVNIGAANQANWERLCVAIDRQDLLADPRFAVERGQDGEPGRARRNASQRTFEARESAHWLEALEREGVPAGPINDMAQVYADPQVIARDMVVELDHPAAGRIRNIGIPVKLSETPASVRRPPPTLGQHTAEVLAELGYAADDIAALRESGAVA